MKDRIGNELTMAFPIERLSGFGTDGKKIMPISVLDLFTIGIGPSSSHCVGPIRAARHFGLRLEHEELVDPLETIETYLYGSLALTGQAHGTDKAILLGLEGNEPHTVDPDRVDDDMQRIRSTRRLNLLGKYDLGFDESLHVHYLRKESLPRHPNGIRFVAANSQEKPLLTAEYYSIGGGFVIDQQGESIDPPRVASSPLPYPYRTGDDLIRMASESGLSISEMTLQNELTWYSREEVFDQLLEIWDAMQQCVERGSQQEGILPGGLKVQRRAAALRRNLENQQQENDSLATLDWVDMFALAVCEENAAGGRVVTAPTNGAAGILPAVLHYFVQFCESTDDEAVVRFLLTAGAIGILYKENASLSGAEVGCQGEVGVACSMAAGALTEVLGGSVAQVEQAAEIGIEHNLGLTCDPVGGLVQVPCIERNAMASVKAINASRLALRGDGQHRVSLDRAIATMRQTGADMLNKYKETSRGGLAVNVPEC